MDSPGASMTSKSSTTYYEKGSEEAVAETALTINRLEQVSPDKRQKNPRFMHVGTSTFSTQLSFFHRFSRRSHNGSHSLS